VPEIEFDPVDTIGAGAVGEPGQRAFYIQAQKNGQVLSVLVEKQQVAMLAERVRILLEQVETQFPETAAGDVPVPLAPHEGALQGDPVPLFRAVAIGIGFDPSRRLVVLELHERPIDDDDGDDEEDDDDENDEVTDVLAALVAPTDVDEEDDDADDDDDGEGYLARLYLTASQARAMATRGSAAVERGRPPCPLCGGPLDPSGHICPRLNGHGRHDDA
jgi:uncharacterized repeat protein (TIGR03847 family)